MRHTTTEPLDPRCVTLAQWAEMGEDEPGELVDGQLVEEEDAGALHDAIVGWLIGVLTRWIAHGGVVLVSDARFGVSSTRGRKPDTSVYFPGRKPAAHGLVTTPPDIMIEVVSPSPKDARRDRVDKMNDYADFGVRFYWIVDPALRSFELFELDAKGRYVRAIGRLEGKIEAVPGCEGLSIDLDALWALADRLESGD